ncbi:MAG: hypothetical protein WAO98_05950 [Alphaproteobacteria bacterium]
MSKILHLIVLIVMLLAHGPALAAKGEPDPMNNPVLASIAKLGTKLYYLGTRAGLDGWFIFKDNRMQILYSTPDKKHALVGALFGENGENITAAQVQSLMNSNLELSALVTNAAAKEQVNATAVKAGLDPNNLTSIAAGNIPTAPTASPGEQLVKELAASSGVVLGEGSSQVFMIMDPNCPHCQKTWRALRESVVKNQLQIFMVPIGAKDSDNERAAARLLRSADALQVWDKYVEGDKSQLAGVADPNALSAVRANHILVDRWNITATPYLVYRDKLGKVKVLQGEPDKVSAVLTDVAP